MEDPGPNVLEQQIETNRLLALILAGAAAPAPGAGSNPGLVGGSRGQWPILFHWSGGAMVPFLMSGVAGYEIASSLGTNEFLSNQAAIMFKVLAGFDKDATCDIGIPMGPSLAPRIQLAYMSNSYPYPHCLLIYMTYQDQTNKLEAGIKLCGTNLATSYLNTGGTWTEIHQHKFYNDLYDWNYVDIVLNFAEAKYHFLRVNATPTDLSAISMKSAASGLPRRLTLKIELRNSSASDPAEMYVDEILVTDHLYAPEFE